MTSKEAQNLVATAMFILDEKKSTIPKWDMVIFC